MDLLLRATTKSGTLASITDRANYHRIFARDGVICGLAGVMTGHATLINGLRATLQTLADCQGPEGQIPSNVAVDLEGNIGEVSYGGLAGRVDNIPWFIIGVCNYAHATGDMTFAEELAPAMTRGFKLLTAWEFNNRGLVYVPQAGDWADEYLLHGYVLHDQLLRLWALRCHAAVLNDPASSEAAQKLTEIVRINYWPRQERVASPLVYHPRAYQLYLAEQERPAYWLASLSPAGYNNRFDAFSNALSILLDLSEEDQRTRILEHGQWIAASQPLKLVPAFWPPVLEDEEEWQQLRANYKLKFSNYPYQYHNGGTWPMVAGWWGMALVSAGRTQEAQDVAEAIDAFNRLTPDSDDQWGFYEYGHTQAGTPAGTRNCTWSAAGGVLVQMCLEGRTLFWG